MTAEPLTLSHGGATAVVAQRGAELVSWQVAGRELIWKGDPAFWAGRAPILFPVVGASADAQVRVDGRSYPMPQHGFARISDFEVTARGGDFARLRLRDTDATRAHYPFAFHLDVEVRLAEDAVHLAFEVENTGTRALPYALGYHPAFPWPFEAGDRSNYSVFFDEPENPEVPLIAPTGLLDPTSRRIPLDGARLPLSPHLFDRGALVFRNASSRRLQFVAPSGSAIALEAGSSSHLALWTKPDAPFLSMEAWTGHADWQGSGCELAERDSMRILAPGARWEDRMALRWIET